MRNLFALFACSAVIVTASASEPITRTAIVPSKPAGTPAATAKIAAASPAPAAIPQKKEEDAEVDLSEKIAARLADLRAKQAARADAAARAKKVADAKRREEELAAIVAATAPRRGTHWSYEGESGPANWSKINSDWAACSTGRRQSPIDIRDGIKVDLEQITFDYHPSSFNEIDNGHTIQVNVGGGNFITVGNQTYELQQFHFHRPSEERINGKGTEMVMHLVHKSAEGRLAVVAVLLERGKQHNLIQTVWNNLPLEKNETVSPSLVLDLKEALPERREYYTYMGSLTTPPCTEGVLWLVMKQPMQASPAQMALFSRLYPLNARPVQSGYGRMIKESN
ncbi:carbonic anhydrase [Massilia horti]|uniref:carbonic anhydrase n=1 Tax=Massilia horti TaxID=2562153 RepID=A0A4Y9SQ24_9BURK|nr:carbonic anhydrase family protein [Massilia horti]TFW28770.1 carbonic anhydrase family protein [Massilia horti]